MQQSAKQPNISVRDRIFANDYDQYIEHGTIPYWFITHVLLLVISTYTIILHSESLDDLVFHNRAIQSSFFFHEDTDKPTHEYKKYTYISNLPDLLTHLDKTIYNIYNINSTLTFDISFAQSNNYKLNVEHLNFHQDVEDISHNFNGTIKNEKDNPIRNIGDTTKIQKWWNIIKSIIIELEYNCTIGDHYSQIVVLEWKYDFLSRAIIKYDVNISYSTYGFNLGIDLRDMNIIFIILQILWAAVEIGIVLYKIYYNLKVWMVIKTRWNVTKGKKESQGYNRTTLYNNENNMFNRTLVSNTIDYSINEYGVNNTTSNYAINSNSINEPDIEGFIDNNDTNTNPKKDKKTKWNKIKTREKLLFIPKWFYVFLIGAWFQIMSGVLFLSSNSFTPQNIVFFGFSSMFSWVALGYYFKNQIKYSYIYDTVSTSFSMYSKLIVVFITLFSGFGWLHLTLFPSSEHWFNGGYNAFQTLGAEVFGDSYLIIWTSTISKYTFKTLLFAFAIYVIFTGCHWRVMFVMTEESFQHVLMKKKFDWDKKKQISVQDYINHEIQLNEEEEIEDKNYFLDDIWIKAVVEKDDVNQILNFDVSKWSSKLSDKLYNLEQIKAFFYKKAKKIHKDNISGKIINEIFSYDFSKDILGLKEGIGKTDTIIMFETHRGIEQLFSRIKKYISDIGNDENIFDIDKRENDINKKIQMLMNIYKKIQVIKSMIAMKNK